MRASPRSSSPLPRGPSRPAESLARVPHGKLLPLVKLLAHLGEDCGEVPVAVVPRLGDGRVPPPVLAVDVSPILDEGHGHLHVAFGAREHQGSAEVVIGGVHVDAAVGDQVMEVRHLVGEGRLAELLACGDGVGVLVVLEIHHEAVEGPAPLHDPRGGLVPVPHGLHERRAAEVVPRVEVYAGAPYQELHRRGVPASTGHVQSRAGVVIACVGVGAVLQQRTQVPELLHVGGGLAELAGLAHLRLCQGPLPLVLVLGGLLGVLIVGVGVGPAQVGVGGPAHGDGTQLGPRRGQQLRRSLLPRAAGLQQGRAAEVVQAVVIRVVLEEQANGLHAPVGGGEVQGRPRVGVGAVRRAHRQDALQLGDVAPRRRGAEHRDAVLPLLHQVCLDDLGELGVDDLPGGPGHELVGLFLAGPQQVELHLVEVLREGRAGGVPRGVVQAEHPADVLGLHREGLPHPAEEGHGREALARAARVDGAAAAVEHVRFALRDDLQQGGGLVDVCQVLVGHVQR
mmetsp:Transcript_64489/g.178805  ORF Transcript_64489/g.178805 Transcript_64489/m.178805 type:complete len:510 (+) Transcript_64489:33-1562(+)